VAEKQDGLFLELVHREAREEAVKRSTLKLFMFSEISAASMGGVWMITALLERNVWNFVKSLGFFMWMLDGARRDYKTLYGKPLAAPLSLGPYRDAPPLPPAHYRPPYHPATVFYWMVQWMYDLFIETVPHSDEVQRRLVAFGHPGPPSDTYEDGIGDEWAREVGEAWVNEGHTREGRTQWRKLAPGEPAPRRRVHVWR